MGSSFFDTLGIERLHGRLTGGGSVAHIDALFSETPGAGTYTALLPLQAGSTVLGILLFALAAPWDATTVVLDIGDSNDPTGYASGMDLHSVLDFAYAIPGQVATSSNTWSNGDFGGSYSETLAFSAPSGPGVFYPTDDVMAAVVTTTGAGGSTGRMLMQVITLAPVIPSNAAKA